jgi:multicomponent Na+:H+ antiporter subunit E
VGYALGFLVLMFTQRIIGPSRYFWKVRKLVSFAGFFLWQLLQANLRVAHDVVTPKFYMQPAVLGIPLEAETDAEITLLASLITLTPGTLSLELSEDRRTLYLHAMFVRDRDALRREIKEGFERRLLEVLR